MYEGHTNPFQSVKERVPLFSLEFQGHILKGINYPLRIKDVNYGYWG